MIPSKKTTLWHSRQNNFSEKIKDFKKNIRIDAKSIIDIFLIRKSLVLKLTDNYLKKLWECSRATVQNRLETFEQLGLLKRQTYPPKKEAGGWKQERRIFLILPKASLVSKKSSRSNSEIKSQEDNSTQAPKNPKLSFADYLSTRNKVPKNAWAFWLRKWGANPRSMGYLLSTIYKKISHAPDILERILYSAEDLKLKDKALVGFVVSQIKIQGY
jgi:hypothetical protein